MSKAKIYYHDIGDYLSREEKLSIVQQFGSVENMESLWQVLQPNEHGDWLNQRDESFGNWIPIEPEKKFDLKTQSFFNVNAIGTSTNRDTWVYNFSKVNLEQNMKRMISFYNQQQSAYAEAALANPKLNVDNFIDTNPEKISWTVNLKKGIERNIVHKFKADSILTGFYRPYTKQKLFFDNDFVERPGLNRIFFPTPNTENRVICVSAAKEGIPVLMSDCIPDLHFNGDTQCFPLYYYEERAKSAPSLFDGAGEPEHIRRDGVSDFILVQARSRYGDRVTKEDIFYYVYGFLHSPDYRARFSADLKKMLPRLPLVESPKDFWAFSRAGRLLADLHLYYDDFSKAPPAEMIGVVVKGAENGHFRVEKMRFPSKDDKSRILYNAQITIENIPAAAYEYLVNGKSAIEWVMERYAVSVHKDSGIRNDPNDWAEEAGNPRYILDVLLSVIRLSVETVEVVKELPKLEI